MTAFYIKFFFNLNIIYILTLKITPKCFVMHFFKEGKTIVLYKIFLTTMVYISGSQPGCRGTLGCLELVPGVPPDVKPP